MLSICFIIPVHNRKAMTLNILDEVQRQLRETDSWDLFNIIVVDDGSKDGTAEAIANQFPEVVLLRGDGSLWWMGSIVKGMAYALDQFQTDYFVWLNNDLSLAANFISNLLDLCLKQNLKNKVVGGIVVHERYPDWIVYGGKSERLHIRNTSDFDLANSQELDVDVLPGNIVVIPKEVVAVLKLPNAKLFPQNGGDYEYVRQAKEQGFQVVTTALLKAQTNFLASDLWRYMPYWMQWRLSDSWSKKLNVFKTLTSIKSSQNIWLFVNLNNQNQESIPQWKYVGCFLTKAAKLLLVSFASKTWIEQEVEVYLEEWSAPQELAKSFAVK